MSDDDTTSNLPSSIPEPTLGDGRQSAFRLPRFSSPAPQSSIDVDLAGFGWRAIGYLIDTVLVTVLVTMLAAVLGASALVALAMNFVAASLYGALLLALWNGQTVGMRLFHLTAVDAGTRAPVTMRQAFIRSLTAQAFVALEIFGILGSLLQVADLLWPLWDKRNQTLHDKVGKTVVLRVLAGS